MAFFYDLLAADAIRRHQIPAQETPTAVVAVSGFPRHLPRYGNTVIASVMKTHISHRSPRQAAAVRASQIAAAVFCSPQFPPEVRGRSCLSRCRLWLRTMRARIAQPM